jgi:predicted branched-subunit amino acid permease
MANTISDKSAAPPFTWPGFQLGLRLALPVIPGMVAFGLAVGATAARKGLGFIDHMLMNVFVYAGMSQLVAMEAWPERITIATLAALAVICATVNARLLLMTAALQPWLGPLAARKIYPALHLLTDPGWLIAMRYRAKGGSDTGVFFGSGVMLFIAWQCAVAAGYFLGGLIADPRQVGLDLVMPVFFAAMLIPLWSGVRRGLTWAVAGAVALLVQHLVAGWWFIVAGAVAGSVLGGFIDGRD